MRPIAIGVALVSLAAGFGLGRWTAPQRDWELSNLASLRWALEDPDWLTRSYRMSAYLEGLGPENLPEALELLEANLPWLTTDEIRLFMLAWSRFDPAGALERALAWPHPFSRNGAGAALYAWAFRDPQAALSAFQSLEGSLPRDFLEGRLIAGWAHSPRKESASDYIASLPEGTRRLSYLAMLAWELSKQGPDAVVRWAEAVPDSDLQFKTAVFFKAASTLAGIDPPTTAEWLRHHWERPYAEGAARVVARSWAAGDPPAAMAWLATVPDDGSREALLIETGRAWLHRDPAAARAWVEHELPDAVAAEILGSAQPAGSDAASAASPPP